ncbi:MAG: radical SAM protein [Edaphocola sp.]
MYQNNTIGYNSFSDNFIILDSFLHQLFEAAVAESEIEALRDVHEELFDTLKTNGFIINDEVNELDEIKRISYETDFSDEKFELIVNPTMNCNFKCWYCYETHIKDSKMSDETLSKVITLVDRILADKKGTLKNFNLSWFGGEPMLYFDKTVLVMLKEIYPKMIENGINFTSDFTTNGLLINQGILENCKKYGVNSFQITLDGHRERHNQVRFVSKSRGSYDEIVENIKLCLQNQLYVNVRINISKETIDNLLDIIGDFISLSSKDKEYLTFSFHEVWQEEKNLTTDISQIVDKYRENGFRCAYKGEQTASIKHSCYADKYNQVTINYNGDAFKCTARDFESSSKEGVLDETGYIQWNEKFQKRMFDTRFQNKPCLECKILPVCNGGCSQQRIEHIGVDYCVHNFDEERKMAVIKEKFYSRIAQ